jgi:thioredoxin-dependent peroxiredoxin
MTGSSRRLLLATACAAVLSASAAGSLGAAGQMAAVAAGIPKVGELAPPFALASIAGDTVRLTEVLKDGPVVLVMLRGWPGYQCPFCTRQFADFLANADALKARSGRVVFVYPGPGDGLTDHAKAFTAGKDLPAHFTFLTDPNYVFTTAYGLRWDAPKETAYPSTFVLDARGRVVFAETSREHGGRVPVAAVLTALGALGH